MRHSSEQRNRAEAMKGTLYLQDKLLAQLDETRVSVFKTHSVDPIRVSYSTKKLNVGKSLTELHRGRVLTLKLDDGRAAQVVYQHASIDVQGNLVGVLRVLGDFRTEAATTLDAAAETPA